MFFFVLHCCAKFSITHTLCIVFCVKESTAVVHFHSHVLGYGRKVFLQLTGLITFLENYFLRCTYIVYIPYKIYTIYFHKQVVQLRKDQVTVFNHQSLMLACHNINFHELIIIIYVIYTYINKLQIHNRFHYSQKKKTTRYDTIPTDMYIYL